MVCQAAPPQTQPPDALMPACLSACLRFTHALPQILSLPPPHTITSLTPPPLLLPPLLLLPHPLSPQRTGVAEGTAGTIATVVGGLLGIVILFYLASTV